MAFKSTAISITTVFQQVLGPTSAAPVDVRGAGNGDPVQVWLAAAGGANVQLSGQGGNVGAAPALFNLSSALANTGNLVTFSCLGSESLFAGSTVAGGSIVILASRQNAP